MLLDLGSTITQYAKLPCGSMAKNLPAMQETQLQPWVGKITWRREWQPTPVFWPRESHGQRGLADYSLWGHKETDTTELLTFSLS